MFRGFGGVGTKYYRIKTNFSDDIILYLDSSNNIIHIRYKRKIIIEMTKY